MLFFNESTSRILHSSMTSCVEAVFRGIEIVVGRDSPT